jgi:hypothetical protein
MFSFRSIPVKDEQMETQIDRRQLDWVWKRIWKPMPVPSWPPD